MTWETIEEDVSSEDGIFVTGEQLDEGIKIKFLEEDPTEEDGKFGTQQVFKAEDESGEVVKLATSSKRLLRALLSMHKKYGLKDHVFEISRSGEGFDTKYSVMYIGTFI